MATPAPKKASRRRSADAAPATPLQQAVALVGERWTLLVIDALLEGPARFADLQGAVVGIAPNILTQRLRTLEEHGLVSSRPYSDKPVRMVYELTAAARDLAAALHLLATWGSDHGPDPDPTPGGTDLHCPTCQGTVSYQPWCRSCAAVVDPDTTPAVRWV